MASLFHQKVNNLTFVSIYMYKWSNEINLPPADEKIDWREVYQLAFQCTKSSKLITFNYKFLHRRLVTNTFLTKIKVLEDDKCTFCHSEAESLLHFFWECETMQDFWISVFSWLKSCQIIIFPQVRTALGLRPDRSKNNLQINFCLLLAKHYIWLCIPKHKTASPKLNGFLCYCKHIHTIEKNQATVVKKWEPFVPFL